MKCPRCGHDFEELQHGSIMIDRCTHCRGVWLDPGELNRLETPARRMRCFLARQLIDLLTEAEDDAAWTSHQRLKLAIFFSDIDGFSRITDRMEPEEIAEVLNYYFSRMCQIAEKYGGTIDKLVGDSMLVIFGAPTGTNDEDHALRSVRMAWEMQECMRKLRSEWEQHGIDDPFRIRIGINTGFATVGPIGNEEFMDYTAIGSQVNLAARLESHCLPGKILLDFSTNALIQDEFETVSKGEVRAKGFHYPIKTFEVVGPRAGRQ